MPQHKGATRTLVTIVGCAGGVAPAECVGKRLIVDRSAPAAAAHSQKFSIPPGDGEPHLDLDLGVARRPQRGRDTTECRQISESAAGGRRKRTGAYHLCRCYRRIRQCKPEKACTGLSSYRLRSGSAKRNRGRQHEGECQASSAAPSYRFENSGTDDDCYASARFRFSIASSISAVFL